MGGRAGGRAGGREGPGGRGEWRREGPRGGRAKRDGKEGREARWRGGSGRGSSGTKKGRAGTSKRVGLGVGGRVGTTGARPVRPDRSRWTNARLAAAPRVRGRLGGVWQGRRVARRGGGGAAGLASPLPPPRARSAASNRQRRVAGMRGPTGAAGGGEPPGEPGAGVRGGLLGSQVPRGPTRAHGWPRDPTVTSGLTGAASPAPAYCPPA